MSVGSPTSLPEEILRVSGFSVEMSLCLVTVEVRRSCTRGGDGKSDGESMVASIDRPTTALYRKAREVYNKTRYDKLMESRRALSMGT